MGYPPIEYAWRGDVSLAYQIVGSGPVDLIYLQGYLSNIELNWENVALARFLRELSSLGRLIVSDRRGLGLSERFTPVDTSATEVLMDDVRSLTEAVGAHRPVIATGDCGVDGSAVCRSLSRSGGGAHPLRLVGHHQEDRRDPMG